MKQNASIALTALSLMAVFLFSNCKKENPEFTGSTSTLTPSTSNDAPAAFGPGDRINEIVADLALDQYSLHFEKPLLNVGINQTAYGAESYVVYADPQDLICPDPIRFRQRRMPIWRIPHLIWPTCPDYVIGIDKLKSIQELVVKGDPGAYSGLKQVQLGDGSVFLATEKFQSQFTRLQLDQIDKLTADLNPQSFVLFNAPGDFSGGFTRTAYGYGDINKYVLRPNKINLKDIIKPILKGCFDPLVLSTIKERLVSMNPELYKGLNVKQLPAGGAVLGY